MAQNYNYCSFLQDGERWFWNSFQATSSFCLFNFSSVQYANCYIYIYLYMCSYHNHAISFMRANALTWISAHICSAIMNWCTVNILNWCFSTVFLYQASAVRCLLWNAKYLFCLYRNKTGRSNRQSFSNQLTRSFEG